MGFRTVFIAAITALSLSQASLASEVPAQFSTVGFNGPDSQAVNGFRVSLFHGQTESVKGLNMAVLGMSEVDTFEGTSLNLLLGVSKVNKQFSGAAFSLVNWHLGHDTGFNMAVINSTNQVKGVNLAAVNFSKSVAGANIGLVNFSERFSLVDIGAVNYAKTTKFQFGLVNATDNLQGLQIGLINYAENGIFKVLPLINFKHSF